MMPQDYDPYYRWLGIPPAEQPADYYRLLGLSRFENEPEVIRDAAERQMAHVRRYALGKHRDLSQQILNELGGAKACLLNEVKKDSYDDGLKKRLAPTQEPVPISSAHLPTPSFPPSPFDPYHKWLGIPPEEQPPNHYRLLGINLYEGDSSVISNAADQRMAFLKSVQTGRHVQCSHDLLNQVAQVKLCLLLLEKKTAYDAALRQQPAESQSPTVPEQVPQPPVQQERQLHGKLARPEPVSPPLASPPSGHRFRMLLPPQGAPQRRSKRLLTTERMLVLVALVAGLSGAAYLGLANRVNHPPTLAKISDRTTEEDCGRQNVELTGIRSGDGESQLLRLSAASSNLTLIDRPVVRYAFKQSTARLEFVPAAGRSGKATITVTVEDAGADNNLETDGDNAKIRRTFHVIVRPVNDPPTLAKIPDLTIEEGGGRQAVRLSGIRSGDGASQRLRLSTTSNNRTLIDRPVVRHSFKHSTALLEFTPRAGRSGKATITVTVEDAGADNKLDSDNDNVKISRSFEVTVRPLNEPPTLAEIPDRTIQENATLQTVELEGISSGGDDVQDLRVTASSSNSGLIPQPSVIYVSNQTRGRVTFRPTAGRSGRVTMTVTVENGGPDNKLGTTTDNVRVSRTFDVTILGKGAPSPPVLQTANNPFAKLPREISLPRFSPVETSPAPGAVGVFEIGSLADAPISSISLGLNRGAANLPEDRTFEVVRLPHAKYAAAWQCRVTKTPSAADPPASGPDETNRDTEQVIAFFYITTDGHLLFEWAPEIEADFPDQLRNTVLELVAGDDDYQHNLRLRTVERVSPVTVDFNNKSQKLLVKGPALPASDQQFLEVLGIDNFDGGWQIDPLDGRAPYRKSVSIRFTECEGAEIRVTYSGTPDEPQIIVAAYYRIKKQDSPKSLTIKRIEDALQKTQRNLAQFEAVLKNGPSLLDAARDALRSAAARQPRTLFEDTNKKREVDRLGKLGKKIEGRIRRAKNQVPQSKETIEKLKDLKSLLGRLHHKAQIKIRFATLVEGGELELLTTR